MLGDELIYLLAERVPHAVLLAMLATASRALRLVRKLVPAVAFGMPAHATVGALVLDSIVWPWLVMVLLDLLLLLIWNFRAGAVRVVIMIAATHVALDAGLGRLDEELLAEHGIRPIRDALHERVELDAVVVHGMLDVVVQLRAE